jgi:hypothetical protein
MANEIGVSAPAREREYSNMPYPPSVIDRFMTWIEGLPGPVWVYYLVLGVVLVLLVNGIQWLSGAQPFGTFDLYRTSVPIYPIASLALMHYLNRVARRALAVFRPALGASEAEETRLQYELTTYPSKGCTTASRLKRDDCLPKRTHGLER